MQRQQSRQQIDIASYQLRSDAKDVQEDEVLRRVLPQRARLMGLLGIIEGIQVDAIKLCHHAWGQLGE